MNKVGLGGKRKRNHNMFQNLKKRAIEVGQTSERYQTRQVISNTKNTTIDPRALVIFEDASKLVGIDEPKAELIKLLTEEDGCASALPQPNLRERKGKQQQQQQRRRRRRRQPKMVSIVGSGGLGKTTLARQVYEYLEGQFECRAFLTVSRNPDMMKILRTIHSQVSGEDYAENGSSGYTTSHQKHQKNSSETANFLQELGQLKNLLKLVLDFEDRYATRDIVREEAIASSLHNLRTHNLRSITISNGSSFLEEGPLCPMFLTLQKLEKLEISRPDVPQVPEWMASFRNLQQLLLNVKEVGQEGLRILGGLPALLILQLIGEESPYKDSLIINGEDGFRCLRQFHYVHRLMDVMFAAGAMPNLEKFGIFVDADNSEWNGPYDFGLENLPRLTTIICEVLSYFNASEAEEVKADMESAANTHPNRPTLLFERI